MSVLRRHKRRKRNTEMPVHKDRWLISYSDFMTLLLAFFVVMYSISQVNESKYRVLSDTLIHSFSSDNVVVRALSALPAPPVQLPIIFFPDLQQTAQEQLQTQTEKSKTEGKSPELEALAAHVKSAFSELVDQDLMAVNVNDTQLELTLNSDVIFASGSARPSEQAEHILFDMADLLSKTRGAISIEGHTDNVPISSAMFPSNWELSSARAASIVAVLSDHGVDPHRLSVVGYGEFRPIGSNLSEKSRMKNRRVTFVIHKTQASAGQMPARRNLSNATGE